MSVEESPSGSSTILYSHIPVMAAPTPRPPPPLRNAFSSFSMSHLPGVHTSKQQPRHASASASSSHLQASPSSASTSISSIPKFRSLRNMLPFGPRSSSTSSAVQQNIPSSSNSSISTDQRHQSRSASSSPSPSPSPSVRPNQKTGFLHFSSRPSLNISRDGEKEKERSLKARPSLSVEVERHRISSYDQEMPSGLMAGSSVSKPSGISKIVSPRPSVVISRELSPNSIANGLTKEWISRPSPVRSPSPGKRLLPSGNSPLSPTSESPLLLTPELSTEHLVMNGDLSTIIESDTSALSISKHLPPLSANTSRDEREVSQTLLLTVDSSGVNPIVKDKGKGKEREVILADSLSQNGDVSQNWNDEVAELKRSLRNMKIVSDGEASKGLSDERHDFDFGAGEIGDDDLDAQDHGLISFNLSVVDPDLAALLSPNNIAPDSAHHNAALLSAAIDAVTPPPPLSASPSPSPDARLRPPWEQDRTGPSNAASIMGGTMSSNNNVIGPQSSPPSRKSKSRPTSLTLSAASSNSHSTVNSLAKGGGRASVDGPTLNIPDSVPTTSTPTASATQFSSSRPNNTRSSLDLGHGRGSIQSRLGRSFSASAGSVLPERPSTADRPRRQPFNSRHNTPSRPGSTNMVIHELQPPSRGYVVERSLQSTSPVPRASTSLGHSISNRRQARPATHAGADGSPSFSAASRHNRTASERNIFTRNRRRSLSVGEGQDNILTSTPSIRYTRQDTSERPGTRPARSYTSSNVMGNGSSVMQSDIRERGSVSPRVQTPTFYRSNSERDIMRSSSVTSHANGSLYATSRAPSRLLEVRQLEPLNRNTAHSRTATLSELNTSISGRVDSPALTVSTPTTPSRPRTALSGLNSAPASATSGSSSQHQNSEIQSLKEKHLSDMGIMLSALHESQDTTKKLREEIAQLKKRIQTLERELNESTQRESELSVTPSRASPVISFLNQSVLEDMSRGHSRPASRPRSLMNGRRSHTDTFAHPSSSSGSSSSRHTSGDTGELTQLTSTSVTSIGNDSPELPSMQLQRRSTASSLFPVVPSNMAMLLHEDNYLVNGTDPYSRPQSPSHLDPASPSSPTFMLSDSTKSRASHTANRSISSNGSISPTTANFSMLSRTNSPGSLYLKPEHERHLGDMISIDLSAEIPEVEL